MLSSVYSRDLPAIIPEPMYVHIMPCMYSICMYVYVNVCMYVCMDVQWKLLNFK